MVFDGSSRFVCERIGVSHDAPAVVDDAVFEGVLALALEEGHTALVGGLDVTFEEAGVVFGGAMVQNC